MRYRLFHIKYLPENRRRRRLWIGDKLATSSIEEALRAAEDYHYRRIPSMPGCTAVGVYDNFGRLVAETSKL